MKHNGTQRDWRGQATTPERSAYKSHPQETDPSGMGMVRFVRSVDEGQAIVLFGKAIQSNEKPIWNAFVKAGILELRTHPNHEADLHAVMVSAKGATKATLDLLTHALLDQCSPQERARMGDPEEVQRDASFLRALFTRTEVAARAAMVEALLSRGVLLDAAIERYAGSIMLDVKAGHDEYVRAVLGAAPRGVLADVGRWAHAAVRSHNPSGVMSAMWAAGMPMEPFFEAAAEGNLMARTFLQGMKAR